MTLETILSTIPHRPPFLLIDEVVEQQGKRIVCRKRWREDEYFYAGHYPSFPLTPGVLLCEAAMQAGAVLLAKLFPQQDGRLPVVAKMNDVRFRRAVRPGETVDLEVELIEQVAEAFFLRAKIMCEGKLAVRFEFTCMHARFSNDADAN